MTSIIERDVLFYGGEIERLQTDLARCEPDYETLNRKRIMAALNVVNALQTYRMLLESWAPPKKPPVQEPVRVIVDMTGGVCEAVHATAPVECMVVDVDDDAYRDQTVPGFAQYGGDPGIYAGLHDAVVNPDFVNHAFDGFVDNSPNEPPSAD